MSNPGKSVFLIGPGFVGREVIDRLLAEDYAVTTLVRRESYAAEIQTSGAETIVGNIEDSATITKQTLVSDIVIHTATADHLPSVEAVLDGVEKRGQQGKTTIFIHTSGTGLLSDDAKGQFKGDKIYPDDEPELIDALPDNASHRQIDLAIVRAGRRLGPNARLAIILPPLIYGLNHEYKRLSIQGPTLIRFALKHGYAGRIDKGLSVWSQIHVFDLARAYVTLLHWLEEQADAQQVLENPYFFVENGQEAAWSDVVAEIGKALHEAGRIESPEPREIPEALYGDVFGNYSPWVVGSNSRSRANRLRQLGWEPREKGLFESLTQDEIPLILQESGQFSGYKGLVASGKS